MKALNAKNTKRIAILINSAVVASRFVEIAIVEKNVESMKIWLDSKDEATNQLFDEFGIALPTHPAFRA